MSLLSHLPELSYAIVAVPVSIPTLKCTSRESFIPAGAARATSIPGWYFHATYCDTTATDTAGLQVSRALFSDNWLTTQHVVDSVSNIAVDHELLPALLLDDHVKGRRSLAL
jgi:hypothetical protein